MASQTPNINLTLPAGSENVSRQIINDNYNKIDTAIAGKAGQELLGYKETGDTASQTIADGSFVVWKGDLYKANGSIPQGTAFSGSNLTAVSGGGLNSLNDSLQTVEVQLTGFNSAISDHSRLKAWKYGKIVTINGYFSINSQLAMNAVLFSCPYQPNNLSVGHLDQSGNVGKYYPIYINDATGAVVNNATTLATGSYDVNITFICK